MDICTISNEIYYFCCSVRFWVESPATNHVWLCGNTLGRNTQEMSSSRKHAIVNHRLSWYRRPCVVANPSHVVKALLIRMRGGETRLSNGYNPNTVHKSIVTPPRKDCTPSWYRSVLRLHDPSYQYILQHLADVYEQVPPLQIRCAAAPTSTNKVLDVKMHCRASVIEV